MTDISPLIERLAAATGPDRELDRDICCAVQPVIADCWPHWTPQQREEITPRYTGSIDAALTLLPPGFVWECGFSRYVPHQAVVRSMSGAHGGWSGECDSNRAIAICIAALKARAGVKP